jgi:hypothetical protein
MKREVLNTSVAKGIKAGLQKIAKLEGFADHGLPSKGRAIDFLVNNYFVIKAGSEPKGNSDVR